MKTWVSREHLRTGDLPDVCVVTGEDADGLVSVTFSSLPDWTWILLLFGVFPFLVATMFATEVVRGEVPVRREIVTRYHRRKRVSLLAAGIGIAVLALAIGLSQVWLAWTGSSRRWRPAARYRRTSDSGRLRTPAMRAGR